MNGEQKGDDWKRRVKKHSDYILFFCFFFFVSLVHNFSLFVDESYAEKMEIIFFICFTIKQTTKSSLLLNIKNRMSKISLSSTSSLFSFSRLQSILFRSLSINLDQKFFFLSVSRRGQRENI